MQTAIQRVGWAAVCAAVFLLALGAGSLAYGQKIDAAKLRGIVLDDTKAELAGTWKPSTHTKPFLGEGYQHDENAEKGVKSATYRTRLPADGKYRVLVSYTPGDNRATNVPVDVYSAEGSKTIFVNQKQTPPLAGFIEIGEFAFKADQDAVVIIANTETNGHVIIDAVQFVTPDEFKLVLEDVKKLPAVAVKTDQPKPAPEPPAKFTRIPPPEKFQKLTSAKVDELLGKELGDMAAAPIVNDELFLRRATLDIAGRQPTVAELEAFNADTAADKRAQAVDRLLASSDYGRNWANYWSDVIGSRQQEPELTFHNYTPFKEWLGGQMNQGAAWDELAFKMLTAKGKVGENPAGTFIAFHQADEKKLAGETSRVFLSVQIACAECHDHPFIEMPMETFHGMAAFFVRTEAKIPWNDSSLIELASKDAGEHKIPGKKDEMKPIALSGVRGTETYDLGLPDVARRTKLAQWIVHPQNPFFARAYANRVFARLMGRGFYEPVDDIGETAEEPILRDVHEALAAHFVASGHDHRDLVRLLANTRAYQRAIAADDGTGEKPLAAATTKKLRGDEVFDSLVTAIGLPNVTPPPEKPTDAVRFPIPPKSTRDLVNEAFGYDPSFKDDLLVRSMKQAMFMMNNEQLQKQIDARPESKTFLAGLLAEDQDDTSTAMRLYRAILARSPSEKELKIVLAHVAKVTDRNAAFEDVLWSLINSAEFTTRR